MPRNATDAGAGFLSVCLPVPLDSIVHPLLQAGQEAGCAPTASNVRDKTKLTAMQLASCRGAESS